MKERILTEEQTQKRQDSRRRWRNKNPDYMSKYRAEHLDRCKEVGMAYREAHKDLQEFLASSFDCARVDISPFTNLNSAYSTYYNVVRIYGYPVTVRRKEGKLYLLRQTQK